MSRKQALILLFVLLSASLTKAQNLDQLGVKKGVKLNGSVNLNTVGYYVKGIEQRRDPYNWFVTGNLNVNLFGYDAPFTFSYSNANRSFTQPFNQFSFSPTYKWVKTYIGYNAMTFSSYTLAGHVFLGGGVELTPGKWRIAAMYGRLRKAVPFDLGDSLQYNNAAFKRMGYGLKIGYENNGNLISANIFTAKDELNSIPFVLAESPITPMQNVAMSVNARKNFLKRFFIEGEYAISSLNKDTRINRNTLEEDSITIQPTHNLVKGLLPENATNRYYDAINASIGYQGNWYGLQLKYERIAPEYQTLGAYFFNNDMRNITIIPNVRLLKNTLNLSANVGFQQNNLDDVRASTTERAVGSFNATYAPNEFWNFAATYSNFSSYTNIKPQPDPFFRNTLDTLNFYQISQTMNGSVLRNLGNQQKPQSIMFSASYQKANDRASYEGGNQQSDFITMNGAYTYSIVPSNTTISVAGNYYTNSAGGINTTYWGPTLSLTKAFYEKTLRASLASSYNETSGTVQASPVLNNRVSINYTPKPKEAGGQSSHNFSLGLNVLNRLKSIEAQPAYTELTGTFNYTYTF
jgi:hypothetical protein